jgi:D-3-phosphoglycerate dehydrogenase
MAPSASIPISPDPDFDIEPLSHAVSNSLNFSISPSTTFHSPTSSFSGPRTLVRSSTGAFPRELKPFATEDIKILLLENINSTGVEKLKAQGYQVDFNKASLPEDELIKKIRYVMSKRV